MEFKKVGIIGAGAVGTYIFWGLCMKDNVDVYLIAEGDRKDRLEGNGLFVNGKQYIPEVLTPGDAKNVGLDLLFVTTKYNSLRPALKDIAEAVSENTVVMSLMNGVDSEDIISEVVDSKQILHSLIKIASERKDNEIKFDPTTTIGVIFGEKDRSNIETSDKILDESAVILSERERAVLDLFEGSGVNYRHTDKILSEIWSKFRLNVANNQPQAFIGCGVGAYTDSEHVAFLQGKLKDEVDAIAKAKGILLPDFYSGAAKGTTVKKRARYSTLQDIDAKRHTEVDMFAGTVVRMGKELGIPTPYNEFTYHTIKALEEKNDGLFDYE